MKKSKIRRAWRDEEYRLSLSEEERRQLPASPAGAVQLDDSELFGVTGACGNNTQQASVCWSCGGGGGSGMCGFEP